MTTDKSHQWVKSTGTPVSVLSNNTIAQQIAALEHALLTKPASIANHRALGGLYFQQKRFSDALRVLESALAAGLESAELMENLACVRVEMGRWDAAEIAFQRSLTLDNTRMSVWRNRGSLSLQRWDLETARHCFEIAVTLEPDSSESQHGMGLVHQYEGNLPEAEAAFIRALALNPQFTDARLSLAETLLQQGQYAAGWAAYESRLQRAGHHGSSAKFAGIPRWQGETLTGKTLLIHAEQGFGDTLQFVRYALALRQRHPEARILLAVMTPLLRLFQQSAWPGIEVIALDKTDPVADFQLPLMSLPFALDLPWPEMALPYAHSIKVNASDVQLWKSRLQANAMGETHSVSASMTRVGIAWTGRSAHSFNDRRSLSLGGLNTLLTTPGIHWVALQKEPEAFAVLSPKLLARLQRVDDLLSDFADTAALIESLDAVVTIDTSIAHLAGTLGKQTFMLLATHHDWRWPLHGPTSDWYPSLHLLHQSQPGDWHPVINETQSLLSHTASLLGQTNLGKTSSPAAETPLVRLNLGCGAQRLPGYINADRFGDVDVMCNLEAFPWPWADNSVDEILLKHVLEHLGESTETFMNIVRELYRICKPNATIHIIVPHPRHDDFLHDPTHVRAITNGTMRLFSKTANRKWQEKGYANSRLGLYLDVDFDTVKTEMVPAGQWAVKFAKGEITPAQLDEAASMYNNVIKEIKLWLVVRKELPAEAPVLVSQG